MRDKLPLARRFTNLSLLSKVATPPRMSRTLPFICAFLATSLFALALCKVAELNLHGFGSACELFLVFLWLACLAALARGKLRDALILPCSLIFGLAALEALAAKTEGTSAVVVGKGFFAYKPGIGWGAAGPGIYPAQKIDPRTGAVIFDVKYTIDSSLLRKTDSANEGPTIAFFGDSFTFGEGVGDGDTMPQAFADLTDHRLRVLNLGFPGYGPQQVLYMLETGSFDAVLGADVRLLVLTTAPWQAERTTCKPTYTLRSPRYRLREDRVERNGACSDGLSLLVREWVQNTALYRVAIGPYQQRTDRDDIELYIRIVLAAADLAKKKYGVAILIAYIPAGEDFLRETSFTDASIVKRLQNGGAIVIDASLEKEKADGAAIAIPGDGHPTTYAHFARAKSIEAYVAREMPDVLVR